MSQRFFLTKKDYQTLMLASLGAMLDIYDFVIFIFLLNELSQLFFPTDLPNWLVQLQSIGIFAAGFLVRPISGIIIGHFSDRLGRKKMFMFTIFVMALPTLCIGLLPTYQMIGIAAPLLLLTMRILQGIAIGGEIPSGWVFVAEHTPRQHRGLALGILTCGISGGSLLGALTLLYLKSTLDEQQMQDFGWRIPFIIGGIFGLITVYLRRYLAETPVFQQMVTKRELKDEWPIKTVIRYYWPASIACAIMTWSTASVVIAIILLLPMQLNVYMGLPGTLIFQANALATAMMVLGNVSFGYLNDRFGLMRTYLFSWLGIIITSYYFFSELNPNISHQQLILSYMVIGYFAGVTVTMPILGIALFPSSIRVSGISLAYNLSFALTSLITPMIITIWSRYNIMAPAYYLIIAAIVSILTGITSRKINPRKPHNIYNTHI
ncbi:putative MFS family arabinose efflux permease [Orbus hercynius]|uniref:Putative MFS family arabinose efflux permease n=1 Tax=Orbus hercynius TaxID=593135 RepID=A0A495RBF2_9GAMM|nr:MFS transporter [Orbus hercynius]RKS84661.1 putative MFS family arabinose efflux permease [Orbus hercynius]